MFTLDGIFINTLRVFVTVWIFSHLIRHRILQENFPRCATFESILVRICAIQNEIKKMFSFFLRVPVREVTLAKMSCGHCVVCRSHQRLLMYTVLSQNELKTMKLKLWNLYLNLSGLGYPPHAQSIRHLPNLL